jgi:RHS repeat-associated protein
VNSGPSQLVNVVFSGDQALFAFRYDWNFGLSVPGGKQCSPDPLETLGSNPAMPNGNSAQGAEADPVNTATGNFHLAQSDLAVPGRGPGLALARAYNSLDATRVSSFGPGWSFSYGMALVLDLPAGNATVIQEGGSRVPFGLTNGVWRSPDRFTARLVQETNGTWTFTRNEREVFQFDSSGRLISIRDLNGETTTLGYNPTSGKLATVTDAAGRVMTFTWSGDRITKVVGPGSPGREVLYSYDALLRLTGVTDVAGGKWVYSYDTSGRLSTVRDPNREGVANPPVLSNLYDTSGRVTLQTDRLGKATVFDYSVAGETKVTDPTGDVSVDYYTNGLRTKATKGFGTPDAASWLFEYDLRTLGITKVTDPRGKIWTATYDTRGNRTTTKDPLNRTTSATFNGFNQPLTVTDSAGVVTTFTYDANANLLSRSTPLVGSSPAVAETVQFRRDDPAHRGDVTSMVDPRGKVWTYRYDALGYRDQVTDPLLFKTTSTFNNQGWLLTSVSPRGNVAGANAANFTTTYTYTAHGDVATVAGPEGGSVTNVYDKNRNLISVTDALGATTGYAFDANDQLITITRPGGSLVRNEYFDDGMLRKQIDAASQETVFAYNALDRLITQTNPLGQVTRYVYDKSGNLESREDPGGNCAAVTKVGCVTYTYNDANQLDDVNQLKAIDYSDPGTRDVTSVDYDPAGRRSAVTETGGVVTSWSWDSLGRLESSTAAGRTTTYRYDLAGNLEKLQGPTGPLVERVYDDAGRFVEVKDGTGRSTTFGYDADANHTTTTFPSSVNADTFGYDNAGRMTSATYRKGTTILAGATFTRGDSLGRVTGENLTSLPGTNSSFTYTGLNQLGSRNATPFTYDAANNVTGLQGRFQAANVGGQLCWVAATAGSGCSTPPSSATGFTYDQRGNRITETPTAGVGTSFGYDQANRLTSASVPAQGGSGGQYTALATPARVLDTRPAPQRAGLCPTTTAQCTTVPSGGTRAVRVSGQGGIPTSGVAAVAVNVTSIGSTGGGFLTVWGPGSRPNTSNVNYLTGATITNLTITALSSTGTINIWAQTQTDVIVDVVGWYATPTGQAGGELTAINPTRILDTRTSTRTGLCPTTTPQCTTVPAFGSRTVQVSGRGGVPVTGVQQVVVNITAVNGTGAGLLTAWAAGAPQPGTINVSYSAGQVVSALSFVPVAANGQVSVASLFAGTDVVFDVVGWVSAPSASNQAFNVVTPTRVLDTRPPPSRVGVCDAPGCTRLSAGQARTVQITGQGGIPTSGVSAVLVNVTAVAPSGFAAWLTVHRAGTAAPSGSTLAYTTATVANLAVVPLSADGKLTVSNFNGSTDVTLDVQGFYADTATWTYAYDADNLRVSKTSPAGVVTSFDWDKSTSVPQLIAETTAGVTTRYVYGPGLAPVQQIAGSTVSYLHHDQLGSVRLVTDSAGNQTGAATYLPYGELEASSGTLTRFGFAGSYTDPETGLQYLRARYYDPDTAQFLSRDPLVGFTGDPYGYAGGTPLNAIDPTGLAPADLWENALRVAGQFAVFAAGFAGAAMCGASVICGVAVGAAVGFGSYAAANAGTNRWSWGWAIANTAVGGAAGGLGAYAARAATGVAPQSAIGFADDAVGSAYQGMRSGGGHAMRHLMDEGLIPNAGSLASRAATFQDLTSPILRNPSATFNWRLGDTATRAFAGQAGGRQVVVFVAKEGPYQGRVISAVVPDASQVAQWGL